MSTHSAKDCVWKTRTSVFPKIKALACIGMLHQRFVMKAEKVLVAFQWMGAVSQLCKDSLLVFSQWSSWCRFSSSFSLLLFQQWNYFTFCCILYFCWKLFASTLPSLKARKPMRSIYQPRQLRRNSDKAMIRGNRTRLEWYSLVKLAVKGYARPCPVCTKKMHNCGEKFGLQGDGKEKICSSMHPESWKSSQTEAKWVLCEKLSSANSILFSVHESCWILKPWNLIVFLFHRLLLWQRRNVSHIFCFFLVQRDARRNFKFNEENSWKETNLNKWFSFFRNKKQKRIKKVAGVS